MIFYSAIQQTPSLQFFASLGVPKNRRRAVRGLDDFRGYAPGYFLIIENATAMKIPGEIIAYARQSGFTFVHIRETAAAFQEASIEKT